MILGFLGVVSGNLSEASLQEGPCLEDWQGAPGTGLGVERAGWERGHRDARS